MTMASKPIPAASAMYPSLTLARSTARVVGKRSRARRVARRQPAGSPNSRATMFAVPSGTIPMGMLRSCAAAITSATVPSPPAASTRWNSRRLSAAPIASTFSPALVSSTIPSQPSCSASAMRRPPKSLPVPSNAGLTTNSARRRSAPLIRSTGGSAGHAIVGVVEVRMAVGLHAEDIARTADQALELDGGVLDLELMGQHFADLGQDVLRLRDALVVDQEMGAHGAGLGPERPDV